MDWANIAQEWLSDSTLKRGRAGAGPPVLGLVFLEPAHRSRCLLIEELGIGQVAMTKENPEQPNGRFWHLCDMAS